MRYLSCFSGIGGLEGLTPPVAICEIDRTCRQLLKNRFPAAEQFDDIRTIFPPRVEVVVGGWPCQDLSIAGKQIGLAGHNSSLFYSFVNVAKLASAHTIVAENVTNLIKIQKGLVFLEILNEFNRNGFEYCAWRTINARQFGLPHHRNRIFMIASKNREIALSLFRPFQDSKKQTTARAAGFYWTAGSQSICYSNGYIPTIKIGTGISIASPPAVHYDDVIRQITPNEALTLQGFEPAAFEAVSAANIYKMAGNAVAKPVGNFVVDGVLNKDNSYIIQNIDFLAKQYELFDEAIPQKGIPRAGFFENNIIVEFCDKSPINLAKNLSDFLDYSVPNRISARAAKGLLRRLDKSGHKCPIHLKRDLLIYANGKAL
jgi:DNA (cytosine-5)-methyltransferase 1